jgi:hypothetical protein
MPQLPELQTCRGRLSPSGIVTVTGEPHWLQYFMSIPVSLTILILSHERVSPASVHH